MCSLLIDLKIKIFFTCSTLLALFIKLHALWVLIAQRHLSWVISHMKYTIEKVVRKTKLIQHFYFYMQIFFLQNYLKDDSAVWLQASVATSSQVVRVNN